MIPVRAAAPQPAFRVKKKSGVISSRRIFSATARALSDIDLSRRVERSGNSAARVDAAFVIRRCGGSGCSSSTTRSGSNHCGLCAPAEDLAGDCANSGSSDDLLHILTLRLVLNLAHLSIAGCRADRIGVAAEVYRDDTESHHDVVVGILTALELGDFYGRRRTRRNHGAVGADDRVEIGRAHV